MGIRDLSESAGVDPATGIAALNGGLVAETAARIAADSAAATSASATFRRLAEAHVWYPRSTKYWSAPSSRAAAAAAVGTLNATPVIVGATCSIDRIGVQVTGTGGVGSVVRLGVYADSNGVPGALIKDCGTIDGTSATAQEITITPTVNVTAGTVIWIAAASQVGTAPTMRVHNMNTDRGDAESLVSALGVGNWPGLYVLGVAGALPDPFGTPTVSGLVPVIAVRSA